MMNDDVAVSVWVLYGGIKAEHFADIPNESAIKLLLDDLIKLKLPHPKRENIEFISGKDGARGCSFFWPRVTVDGVLHKQVKVRVKPPRDYVGVHRQLLDNLSIVSLTYREQLVMPVDQPPRKLSSQARALPRYANKQWVRQDENGYSPATVPIKVDEAEQLLNNMALTLQPNIRIPKIEPVDPPSLFDALPFPREDSVASSRPSVPPEVAPQPFPAQDLQITESERFPVPNAMRPPSPRIYSIHSTPMSISPSPSAYLNPQPQQAIDSIPSTRMITPEFSPPGFVKIQPISPTIPQKRPLSPDPELGPRPGVRPPPNPQDVPTIQKLTRELWDLRRQVTAGVARETAIIKELRALNSTFIPQPSTQIKSSEDLAVKTKLEAVESELRAERKRREEAETALNDIERECREPFVVPALFEAFVSISRITSQAMDQDP